MDYKYKDDMASPSAWFLGCVCYNHNGNTFYNFLCHPRLFRQYYM